MDGLAIVQFSFLFSFPEYTVVLGREERIIHSEKAVDFNSLRLVFALVL